MTQQTSPFIEGKYGWALGEGNWNLGMDENLLKFSYLFDRNIDGIVSSLPAAVNGTAYFNTTDKRIYFAAGGVYSSTPVPKWFKVTLRGSGQVYQFDGTSLNLGSTETAYTDALRSELEDPLTGSREVGYSRNTLTAAISTIGQMLDAQAINLWEYAHLVTVKPTPADPSTWTWTPAINAFFAALPTGSVGVIPFGSYKAADLIIQNKLRVKVICYGQILREDGTGTDGVVMKGCQFTNLYFNSITTGRFTKPTLWTDLVGSAIKIVDSSNCETELSYTAGFENAVSWYSETASGVYFVKSRIGRARYNRYGIRLWMPSGPQGFINGNSISIGDFRGFTGIKTTKGSGQTDPFNGNAFDHINIEEADGDAVDLDFCHNNTFSHMRLENSPILGRWFKSAATCYGNTYYLNRIPLDKLEIKESNAQFIGPIMNSEGSGARLATQMNSNATGSKLTVLTFQDSGSFVFDSNGTPVEYYVFGSDLGTTNTQDIGVTGFKRVSAAGIDRTQWRKNGVGFADNTTFTAPRNLAYLRVASNTATTKILLFQGDYYEGNEFTLDVTAFTNPISVRNAADTADIIPAGVINSTGFWRVLITQGLGAKAYKAS